MTTSLIPSNTRAPFVFIEIDPSRAQTGPSIQNYRTLNVGQRLAAGTVAADIPFLATSADQVGQSAGFGSILHNMALAYFAADNITEAWFIGLDDAGGGTAGTQTLTVTGTATAAGTLFLYIAGRRIQVAVANADDANTIAASIDAAITAISFAQDLPVTSGVATNVVTLTARNAGTQGNAVDVRFNANQGETFPAGVTSIAVAAGVTGATDPTVAAAIAAMGDEQYHTVALGLNDATSIAAFEVELASRFGPSRKIHGSLFAHVADTHANLITFGGARNSPHSTVVGTESFMSSPWEIAASTMGVASRFGQDDPARPFQTLELPGIVGAAETDRFTFTERDLLLKNGIATLRQTTTGAVIVDFLATTFQTLATGAVSTAFLRVNTMLTLSFLTFDAGTQFANQFGRTKIADDGTRFGPGQVVATPATIRAFFLGVFRGWEEKGLVEGFDQFETDLKVTRNGSNPDRVDIVLAPNLVNQLRVAGTSIQFIN